MLGAFLTTIFFSLSVIFANRSITAVGLTRANLGRLLVAVLCLGAYAHTLGHGLGGAGRDWFLLSGLIGMGLGDLASFNALPLLGSRLAILMGQCLAVPIAILAERLWLSTRLTAGQFTWGAVILAGVALALMPTPQSPPRVRVRPIGFLWGVLSAAGQGLGAVVSRRAAEAATRALFLGTGLIDRELTATEIGAVHLLGSGLRLFLGAHGDEREAAGAAGHLVHGDVQIRDGAELAEGGAKLILGGLERQVADV